MEKRVAYEQSERVQRMEQHFSETLDALKRKYAMFSRDVDEHLACRCIIYRLGLLKSFSNIFLYVIA